MSIQHLFVRRAHASFCGRLLLLLSCLWLMTIATPSFAQAPPDKPTTSQSAEADDSTAASETAEKEKSRQAAIAGMMVLGLVVVVLVLLLLIVIWWAHRFRRSLERPLPKQHPGDPLWYLRKGTRNEPHDDERPTSDSDRNT